MFSPNCVALYIRFLTNAFFEQIAWKVCLKLCASSLILRVTNVIESLTLDKTQFNIALQNFKSGKLKTFPIEPTKPVKTRYIVNDITYQALGEILADNPRGILALADELSGLLQSLDTPGQEAARAKKAEVMAYFEETKKSDLVAMFTLYNHIIDAKQMIISKLNEVGQMKTFLKKTQTNCKK